MPHDERILKTAYKTSSKQISQGGLLFAQTSQGRRAGLSHTPYIANRAHAGTENASPDQERHNHKEQINKDSHSRWEKVLDKKQMNTEQKREEMKKMLAKKFKREKEMETNAKQRLEDKAYAEEQKAERVARNKETKKKADETVEIKKRKELR